MRCAGWRRPCCSRARGRSGVLHLSDLHITPAHHHKAAWVSALADLRPDLVINTGDTLSGAKAVPMAIDRVRRPAGCARARSCSATTTTSRRG